MFIVRPPGIQYANETRAQAEEMDRRIAEHNAAWQKQLDAWKWRPAKFYEKWCRKHAPHLLEES